MERRQLAANAA